MISNVLFVITLFTLGRAGELPSFITPCQRSDSNFDGCLVSKAKEVIPKIIHGNRKLGIPDLSPLKLPLVLLEAGTLKFNLTDISIFGFDSFEILELGFDLKKKNGFFKCHIPQLEIIASYVAGGTVFTLPFQGTGPCNMTMNEGHFRYQFDYEEKSKNGLTHAKISKEKFSIIDINRVYFKFENLFNGNEELARPVNEIFDKEWKSIFDLLKDPVNVIIRSIINSVISGILNRIPLEKLFP